MRLRKVKNALEIVESSPYYISSPGDYKASFAELFGNNNPICLEIGMGKGDFIIGMAEKYPNINFIGLEKFESVMVRAVQKLVDYDLPNLKVIKDDALNLPLIFDKEIDTIYLNFSDPWPKNKHAKRRLTSPTFLSIYDSVFKGSPHIIQKTDNIYLFAYSLSELSKYGYILDKVSLNLANEEYDKDNVQTEYESKFRKDSVKINYLDAHK
jgi:tRNA (guanine-N7-)-methyltransferase